MKIIKKFFNFILFIFLIAAALLVLQGYGKYKTALTGLSPENAVNKLKTKELYIAFDDIPVTLKNAVVAVEDRRFYSHGGIDPVGIFRAVKRDIKLKTAAEGGSTITQQLAKNIYFMGDDSPSRKIAEMFMAIELEKAFSKDEILEYYFNIIYFGSGYYGIGEAAKGYFGKQPAFLSDYECTLLAGLPNAPSAYSPKNNPALAENRRQKVVKAMIREGFITTEEEKNLIQK